MFVSFSGHTEIVKILIENGADVNSIDRRSETPLHCAAFNGNLKNTLLNSFKNIFDFLNNPTTNLKQIFIRKKISSKGTLKR